jgi:putative FmdB family regulatory protein
MPLFEYRCLECGHKFEELVFGQKQIACPRCQSTNTQKLFSAFASGVTANSSQTKGAACNNFT